jgi:hypothetical protein
MTISGCVRVAAMFGRGKNAKCRRASLKSRFRSNGPVIPSPQRSEGRSNPETTPGLLRRFAPRNDESLGSIRAEPASRERAQALTALRESRFRLISGCDETRPLSQYIGSGCENEPGPDRRVNDFIRQLGAGEIIESLAAAMS